MNIDNLRQLLDEATHLNFWRPEGKHGIGAGGLVIFCGSFNEYGCGDTANRDLAVHAVNSLPDLLAAIEALDEMVHDAISLNASCVHHYGNTTYPCSCFVPVERIEAVLRRLRGEG